MKNLILKPMLAINMAIGLGAITQTALADNIPVYESYYNHYRTGANLQETILNTSNVNSSDFGYIYKFNALNQSLNHPLYVPNVVINNPNSVAYNTVHNVLYILTDYCAFVAIDADTGLELFHNFLTKTNVNHTEWGCYSNPIINPSTNTLYLIQGLTTTIPNVVKMYSYNLRALDITTGIEKSFSPAAVSATYTVNGSTISFDPSYSQSRPGLALVNGKIYLAFGLGGEDFILRARGWILGYDASTLTQTSSFVTTFNVYGGGIWQSGRAPSVDDQGNLYYATGNGFDLPKYAAYDGVKNFANSLLKLNGSLTLEDWFTPSDWYLRDLYDLDLSSSGSFIIPGTNYLTQGGKEGTFFLLNYGNLGHLGATVSANQIPQKIVLPNGQSSDITMGPVFWQRQGQDSLMFIQAVGLPAYAYSFGGNSYNPAPVAQSPDIAPNNGAGLSVSANGSQTGTGIVWAFSQKPNGAGGILRALDAENIATEIWNSQINASDNLPNSHRYTIPIVSNGKVFIPSGNYIYAFGLKNSPLPPNVTIIPNQTTATNANVNLAVSASDPNATPLALTYSASNLPAGVTINASSGKISGKPTQAGSYQVTITVSNNQSSPRIFNFNWTITG